MDLHLPHYHHQKLSMVCVINFTNLSVVDIFLVLQHESKINSLGFNVMNDTIKVNQAALLCHHTIKSF